MRVLVTGATGFIGRQIVCRLLNEPGVQVIASGRNRAKAAGETWYGHAEFIEYDLKQELPHPLLTNYDIVIHAAWEDYKAIRSLHHIETQIFYHISLLRNLMDHGVHTIVGIGSGFEFGLREGPQDDDDPTMPASPYALAKDTLHRFLAMMAKSRGVRFQWLRPFNLYGGGQHPESLFGQLDAALKRGDDSFNMSGGEQLRDYLDVKTAADFIVRLALNPTASGAINCSAGQPVSVRALVERYVAERGGSIHLNLGHYPYSSLEPMAVWGSNRKRIEYLK